MMPTEEAARLVYTALEAAVNGDTDTAATLMQRIGEDSDADRMYGVCCAIAAGGTKALNTLYGTQAPNLTRGGYWHIVQLRPALDAIRRPGGDVLAQKFAARFLVAHANGDQDNAQALYNVAARIGEDHFVKCVYQLFADVAGLCALALKHVEAQG